jgi:hypothetical protein
MHGAGITGQMIDGMLALAIHAELIPRTGRGLSLPWALVAHITPEPRGFGLLRSSFGLQLYRCVVSKQRWPCADQLTNMIGQWFQQRRGAAHPVGQRGAVQINLLTRVNIRLPGKWEMVAILAGQHMCEQPGPRTPALDGSRRQRRLRESLAAGTGHAWAHDPAHHEAPRNIFQLFGDIFTKLAQVAATTCAALPWR